MKLSATLILCLFILTSCKSTKPVADVFNKQDADSLFVEMERSVCFGHCPWYNLKIYESGYAVYDGKKNVDKNGVYSTTLSSEDLKKIFDEAQRIQFMNLNERYDNTRVTDLPSCEISVQINGKRKKIYDRFGAPPELEKFEKMIDEISDACQWNKRMPVDKLD